MPNVISNTSCLILLDNLDNIDLLVILEKLYSKVFITPEVSQEFGKIAGRWLELREVKDKKYFTTLSAFIDQGEASTISMALEMPDPLLILDDLKARKMAERLGLKITGTLGVLLRAKEKKIITATASSLLQDLKQSGLRISQEMEKSFLGLSGEM